MRKCPAPVLVVKSGRRKHFRRVLAAIDPESTGSTRDTLNELILGMGSWLYEQNGAELHVVQLWALFGESKLGGWGGRPAGQVQRLAEREAAERREAVEGLVSQYVTARNRLHLVKGDPGDVIPRLVHNDGIDLLVMGTVCRTGIPGSLIGNTAERVLDEVDCSVLTVKPAGFKWPKSPLRAGRPERRLSGESWGRAPGDL